MLGGSHPIQQTASSNPCDSAGSGNISVPSSPWVGWGGTLPRPRVPSPGCWMLYTPPGAPRAMDGMLGRGSNIALKPHLEAFYRGDFFGRGAPALASCWVSSELFQCEKRQ